MKSNAFTKSTASRAALIIVAALGFTGCASTLPEAEDIKSSSATVGSSAPRVYNYNFGANGSNVSTGKDSNQATVEQSIVDVVGAAGSASEIAAEITAINAGRDTLGKFRVTLSQRAKVASTISGLLAQMFNVIPNQGSVASYQAALANGAVTFAGLRAYMRALPDFGADSNAYLRMSFNNMLLRNPQQADLDGFRAWLASGDVSHTYAVWGVGVGNSPEAQNILNSVYQHTLGRLPNAIERASQIQALLAGTPLSTVESVLLNLPEFSARYPGPAQAPVAQMYVQILGREVDVPGLKANSESLSANRSSTASVRQNLAQSPEADNAINSIYANVTGNLADPTSSYNAKIALAAGSKSLLSLRIELLQGVLCRANAQCIGGN